MKKISSYKILITGFGTLVLLLILMSAYWIDYINQTSNRVEEILTEQNETKMVFNMRDAAHKRTLILHQIAFLDDIFERDEASSRLSELASDFIYARDALLGSNMSEEEVQVWQRARAHISRGGSTQLKTVELFLEEQDSRALELLLGDVMPTQENVMVELTNMLEIQHKAMNQAANKTVKANKAAHTMVLLYSLGFLLIASVVAGYTIRISAKNENELIKAKLEAESASKYKSLFVANMSHEIRTPLTAINGYAESLLSDRISEVEKLEYINTIVRNGKHLLRISNDILDLSKIEANKLAVESISFSLLEVLASVESVMGDIARRKGIEFIVKYDFPLPKTIKSDPSRLKQILLNLTGNAIKFTECGSVSMHCGYDRFKQKIVLTIKDTGIGIDKHSIENIFKPFDQADASMTRKYGGTGLGLTISKQLANLLGGDLECESQAGKGSQFTLTVSPGILNKADFAFDKTEVLITNKDVQSINVESIQGNILLAEDSSDIQNLVTMYLKKAGAKVVAVENGKLAIEKAMLGDFDLILMDMQMPEMDGIQATEYLRCHGYTGNIIALTANAMKVDRERFLTAGVNDFLAKPIELEGFYALINKYIEKNDSPAEESPGMAEKEDAITMLTRKFKQGLPSTMNDFSTALENKDAEALQQVAHKLKGIGGSFGYAKISDISSEIEVLAKKHDLEHASIVFKSLDEMCREIASSQ